MSNTKYVVEYFEIDPDYDSGGYTAVKDFQDRAQAAEFAQLQTNKTPNMPALLHEVTTHECEHCDFKSTNLDHFVTEPGDVLACETCHENCPHEWDMGEGGSCLNCGRDNYYNFFDEDYGQDR